MNLQGKTALLTGASGGIGRAIAPSLAAEGVRLVLNGRHVDKLERLRDQLQQAGHSATIAVGDISEHRDRQSLREHCECEQVDLVIHNAGVLDFRLLVHQDTGVIASLVNLNLVAPILLTRALLPQLAARPEGAIVFIGSTFGSIGHPGFAAYCASKFGLRGFAESLRRELADTDIVVHYLAPRATRTELNSPEIEAFNESIGNAVDDPNVVADELIKLLSQRRGKNRYLGWPEKLFVRINSLLPSVVDSALAKKLAIVRNHAPGESIPNSNR